MNEKHYWTEGGTGPLCAVPSLHPKIEQDEKQYLARVLWPSGKGAGWKRGVKGLFHGGVGNPGRKKETSTVQLKREAGPKKHPFIDNTRELKWQERHGGNSAGTSNNSRADATARY